MKNYIIWKELTFSQLSKILKIIFTGKCYKNMHIIELRDKVKAQKCFVSYRKYSLNYSTEVEGKIYYTPVFTV